MLNHVSLSTSIEISLLVLDLKDLDRNIMPSTTPRVYNTLDHTHKHHTILFLFDCMLEEVDVKPPLVILQQILQ